MAGREKWMTVREAAQRLGISAKRVRRMAVNARINGRKAGRFWALWRDDVEEIAAAWERQRQEADDKVTRWQGDRVTGEPDDRVKEGEGASGGEAEPGVAAWIGTTAAAGMLDLTTTQVRNLARTGLLTLREAVCKLPGRSGGMRRRFFLLREEVARLAAQRAAEAVARQAGETRLRPWGDRAGIYAPLGRVRPGTAGRGRRASGVGRKAVGVGRRAVGVGTTGRTANTSDGPGEGGMDDWMTTAEAAEVLEVGTERVSELVETGLLPAYQRRPGKKGSPLWLPEHYVMALAQREEHLERRARYAAGQAGQGRRLVPAWEEAGLPEYDPYLPSALTERDYGPYYTVRRWVRRGRLRGYHKPRSPKRDYWGNPVPSYRKPWWFLRKEEVHALMGDPAYQRRRRAQALAASPEGREAREARRLAEWFAAQEGDESKLSLRTRRARRRFAEWYEWWRKASALGRDPKCHIRSTGFVWDGVVETY